MSDLDTPDETPDETSGARAAVEGLVDGRRLDAAHPGSGRARRRGNVRRPFDAGVWYAADIEFQRALEAGLGDCAEHRGQVTCRLADPGARARQTRTRVLVYEHAGLDVPARRDLVPVCIEFHENPTYPTYGLPPWDYPRVFADPGAISKHRLGGDALCLWYPRDPEDRRWHYEDGLVTLLNIVRNHLFFEDHWRATGGHGAAGQPEGEWLGNEAPHGFPGEGTAA